jgi:glutathione S-transferase
MSAWIVLVTIAALLLYFYMGTLVAGARRKHGIAAPAVSGHPEFERTFRVQMNTLEWLPIFLPVLWIAAAYWNPVVIAAIGVVWIVGRAMYMQGYLKEAGQRSMGFMVQALAVLALMIAGAIGAILSVVAPA